MSDQNDVLVERNDTLLKVTLNRPQAANALSQNMVEQLISAFTDLDGIRLCVIEGNGKHFCAGFDLSGLEQSSDGDLLWRFVRVELMLQMVHHAPIPILALAHGRVVGAGADLFVACWQRVATANAVFSMPGWNFELALGTRRLTQLVGSRHASELLLETRQLAAPTALEMGLATELAEMPSFTDVTQAALKRASMLPAAAVRDMLELTRTDTREADMASIVLTAGKPGLRDRIAAYRERVIGQQRKSADK